MTTVKFSIALIAFLLSIETISAQVYSRHNSASNGVECVSVINGGCKVTNAVNAADITLTDTGGTPVKSGPLIISR